jgi:hypothetical protein
MLTHIFLVILSSPQGENYLPASLFSEDTVDQFFFAQTISAWDDARLFCTDMLQRNVLQQNAARNRRHDLEEANEEILPHLTLHSDVEANSPNGANEANDAISLNDDFQPSISSDTTSASRNQDLTGEIPEPIGIDRLVGPGDISSEVRAEGQRIINNCNITRTIMAHRRKILRTPGTTDVEDLL